MAGVGSNNVYVDIIFRLQAEAAKRAERIIGNLIKKGHFASLALKRLGIPSDFPKTTLEVTTQIFRLAQGADAARRTNSALWQQAISPLLENFRQEAKTLESLSDQYLRLSTLSWESLQSQAEGRRIIQELGLTEQNYANVLSSVGQAYGDQATEYYKFIKGLKEGRLIHQGELKRLKEAWNIYKATGIRLAELRESSISLGKKWESLVPLSERVWKPTTEQINTLAKGLSALDETAARDMMTMARHAAVAKAFNEPIANIDENAYRLLGNLDQINFRLAKMGITLPITTKTSKDLAQAHAQISEETRAQARAFAESAASLDRLGISARGNLALGSQLYDIFTGNSRMALELEDSVRAATGVLDRHARGLHLVNRALREQNANFAITQETINRITREGWGAFTEEQKKALQAIKKNYETTLEYTGVLDTHERALLRVIRRTEMMDRALHFQLKTAEDAAFLLKRLQTEGYDALTDAEKRAIRELEKNIAQTWTWDADTKRLAHRIIAVKNAYTQQGAVLRKLTPRQRAFYGAIYHLQTGMGKLSRFIDRVSIGSLKLLGPIFLATAAINTFGRIIGTCVESFTNYEAALMDLRVSGGLTVETANRLSQAFTSLERILPISATQMLSIARAAAKAGVTGEVELKRFTLALAKFTQVTGWSAEEASEALLKISRAFRVPIENAEYLASMMHYLAIVSVADADDIVNALSRVGASAVNLGITADEAAAMATTLIDAGMGAERAGTRLRAFLREFLEKSEKITAVMERAGDEFRDFGDTIRENPAKALKEFLKYLSSINDEAERARIVYEIFGSVAGFAVLTLTEHYPLLEERMEAAHREMIYGTRLSKDFSKWMDATSVSLKKASNSFDRLKRSMGAALAPAVETLSNWFTGLIEHIFPETREGIKLMSKGTAEWVEVFKEAPPFVERTMELMTRPAGWMPPGLEAAWKRYRRGGEGRVAEAWRVRRREMEQTEAAYSQYVQTVLSGTDDIFARTGEVISLLEEEGITVDDLRDKETQYYVVSQDIRKARELQGRLEEKYGQKTLENIYRQLRENKKVTDATEEQIKAAQEWGRYQEFIARADLERARIKKDLIDSTVKAARAAADEGTISRKNLVYIDDYLTHYKYYSNYLNLVNRDRAIGLALLSKEGPLFADLKRNIPSDKLADFGERLEEGIILGKGAGPVIQDLNKYLADSGYILVFTSDGWRLLREEEENYLPIATKIREEYKALVAATESLDARMRRTAETVADFFEEFNKGWRIIDNYIDAIFGTAEAKTELDRRLRYTAPGIMFRRQYEGQIRTLEELVAEYETAAKAGDMNAAAQRRQALMAHMVAFAQQVVNDVMSEQNPILRQQKMGWLDLVRYFYQWIYGVTGEVPAATAELDKFAETALNIPGMAELTTYLNLNTDPATTKLNEWIEQNTGKTIEIQITPIMSKEIAEWIKAAPAGAVAGGGGPPAAQTGGYVLRTGYALIHKGEFILPRELVEEIRRGRKKERVEVSRQLAVHINNLNVGRAEDFQRFIRELESYYV